MKIKIYFISGLGADRRAFRKLIFPQQLELVHLDWIPALKNESLSEYANESHFMVYANATEITDVILKKITL